MSKPVILVVEDSEELRKVVERALVRQGYRVVVAGDGAAALEVLRTSPVDLLITDVLMPGRDGIETLVEVQDQFPALPVIVMSGGGLLEPEVYLDSAAGLGARRTLAKPFRLTELFEATREALESGAA